MKGFLRRSFSCFPGLLSISTIFLSFTLQKSLPDNPDSSSLSRRRVQNPLITGKPALSVNLLSPPCGS